MGTSGVATIVIMASTTVASAVTQIILKGMGKADESQILDLTTKSGLILTALTIFAKAMKAIMVLV